MCSIIGSFAIGIIGLGWLLVSGRSRVPSPPARITAFMHPPPPTELVRPGLRAARRARRDVLRRGVVAEDDARRSRSPSRTTRRTRATRPATASAPRNSGSANISASVPALPAHCTSMRRAPATRERDRRDRDRAPRGRARATATTLTAVEQPSREQRDRGRDEQHAVGDRVEDLAELAALVEVAGDVAVDPVGRAEHREQQPRRGERRRPCPRAARGTRARTRSRSDRDQVRDRPDARACSPPCRASRARLQTVRATGRRCRPSARGSEPAR